MAFKQADRLPTDGAAGIERDGDHLILYVETADGRGRGSLRVSFFNAARLFGMLALFLGIKLPAALGKAIRL
jgi:hypothetical protein